MRGGDGVSDVEIRRNEIIKKWRNAPTENSGRHLAGPLAPRQNGQRNSPKIIIQFFFCVVNTALSDFTAFCAAPTAERKSRKSL